MWVALGYATSDAIHNRCPFAFVSLLVKDGMALHCQQHLRSRTHAYICMCSHARASMYTNLSTERSVDGDIRALIGIWPMANCYYAHCLEHMRVA